MTTTHPQQPRQTATIYQFPIGGRAAVRRPGEVKPAEFRADYPAVDFGAGWYHDAAIEEATRKTEH